MIVWLLQTYPGKSTRICLQKPHEGQPIGTKYTLGFFSLEKEELKQLQTYMKGQYDIFTQSIFQLF